MDGQTGRMGRTGGRADGRTGGQDGRMELDWTDGRTELDWTDGRTELDWTDGEADGPDRQVEGRDGPRDEMHEMHEMHGMHGPPPPHFEYWLSQPVRSVNNGMGQATSVSVGWWECVWVAASGRH